MSYREEVLKIYQKEGFMGFTRGYTGMLLRDSPGFGIHFCLFELLKRTFHVQKMEEEIREKEGCGETHYCMSSQIAIAKFLCGGTAGCLTWTVCYPLDTVKSKMQTYEGTDRLSLRKVFLDLYKEHGLLKLYRGIHVQLMRAFPSTASSLLIYETV
jgi:solute carrier family 25 carnitine/acylcarnitine transporter 20/29